MAQYLDDNGNPIAGPGASPYANPGPYITTLPPGQEKGFQSWVKQNKVPFDPSPTSDYDMRGYYKDNVVGAGGQGTKTSAFDGKPHFPDTYKTPYHKTFSNESKYATPDAPRWQGDKLVGKDGKVVADETPASSGKQYLDDNGNPVGAPASTAPPKLAGDALPSSSLEQNGPMDRTFGNYASEAVAGVGRGIKNDLTGVVQTVLHPIDTAEGLMKQANQSGIAAGQEWRDTAGAPLGQRLGATALTGLENAPLIGGMVQHAEQGGEQMGSPEALGAAMEGVTTLEAPKLVGPLARGLKATSEAARNGISGTGPGATADLVKATQAENAAAVQKAADTNAAAAQKVAEKNADIATKRQAAVEKVGDKISDVRAGNLAKDQLASRKVAIDRGVQKLSDQFHGDLKTLRDAEQVKADAKYADLKEALGTQSASPDFLPSALGDAAAKIEGSNTEPPIFKDMLKRLDNHDELSYGDLQGYYSELGRELRKGSLPGDVYTAYGDLQDAIGGEMQRIADKNGMGPQLQDARDSWRNLKQTFYDKKSPLKKALDTTEPGAAIKMLAGKDRTGIEALAKYDPDLAARANVIRRYVDEGKSITTSATRAEEPTLPPKTPPIAAPQPIAPETSKIGEQDVRAAKTDSLNKRADWIEHRGALVATWPLLHAMSSIMHGNVGNMVAEGATTYAGVRGVAAILRHPKVVDLLTKATDADIAKIPADLRGDFPSIVKQAQTQGIKISPALKAAFGKAAQGAAYTGPLTKQLQDSRSGIPVQTGTDQGNTGVDRFLQSF